MPAKTALVAFASAATGAFATAIFYNISSNQKNSARSGLPLPVPPPSPEPIGTLGRHRNRDGSGGPGFVSPVDPAGLFVYGFPGPVNDLATRKALVSAFDRRTRNPMWVAEHITPASLAMKDGDRKGSAFLEDEAVPEKFRGKLKDYYRSGYDRGHQVPAADAKFNQEAMNETFYLTNMCPQVGDGFNRDYWAHLEDFCRRLTKKYTSVRIITGPLYLPKRDTDGKYRVSYEVIGSPPNIAVPTHFFKVIVAENEPTSVSGSGPVAIGAFVLPNAAIHNSTKLEEFEVPLEVVERASGLEFLKELGEVRRRRLCGEVECSLTVREFNNAARGGGGQRQLPVPGK